MLKLALLSLVAASLMSASAVAADGKDAGKSVHAFTVNDIDGKPVDLSQYKGKVLLVVNTASKCGNTPQYKQLEEVYQKYKAKGFEVLAFPANEFGRQEPGTNEQIKAFCTENYKTSFPLFSKIVVKGSGIHPLYQHLTNSKFPGEVQWNFAKFLVDRNGQVVGRFAPKAKPDTQEIVTAIEQELAKG